MDVRVKRVAIASAPLLAFLMVWEGVKQVPYFDTLGQVWTVCAGNTQDVVIGKKYSAEECAALLSKDIEEHGHGALRCIQVPINRNQMVALVSLAYNIGVQAFCGSSLVRALNEGKTEEAADQFLRWSYANGEYVRGLNNRRKAEKALFLKPDTVRGAGAFG